MKSKLRPDIIDTVVDLIVQGAKYKDIWVCIGISHQGWYNWIERGEAEIERVRGNGRRKVRKSEQLYVDLVERLKKAKIDRKLELLKGISFHGHKQWTALAWILEREYSDEYARPPLRHEHAGNDR